MLTIIIDDREQKIIPYLQTYDVDNINIKVQRLLKGDYAIMYKDKLIVLIERKTWLDLSSSLKDGRKENVHKLFEARDKSKCLLLYLIEGNLCPDNTESFANIPYKNLRAHLDHLIMRDNIHIMHTISEQHTAKRLIEFAKNITTIKPSILPECNDDIKNDGNICEKQELSDEQIKIQVWSMIPYITEKTAMIFIKNKISISDIILQKISIDEIANLQYESGMKIGNRASKIFDIKDNINSQAKLLSGIRGITLKTGNEILKNISLNEILIEKNIEKISAIKKSEKNKVGKKIAENIIKFLS